MLLSLEQVIVVVGASVVVGVWVGLMSLLVVYIIDERKDK